METDEIVPKVAEANDMLGYFQIGWMIMCISIMVPITLFLITLWREHRAKVKARDRNRIGNIRDHLQGMRDSLGKNRSYEKGFNRNVADLEYCMGKLSKKYTIDISQPLTQLLQDTLWIDTDGINYEPADRDALDRMQANLLTRIDSLSVIIRDLDHESP